MADMMPWRATIAALCLASMAQAEPRAVDRLVARVDGAPILLSDLMRRTRPRLRPLAAQPGWKRSQALRTALREERELAIEQALFSQTARRRGIAVTDSDVAAALRHIASDQRVSVDEVLALAHAAGLSERAYREELRLQLREQRLLFAEPWGPAGSPPIDGEARLRWQTKRRELVLAELGRRACVERFGRL